MQCGQCGERFDTPLLRREHLKICQQIPIADTSPLLRRAQAPPPTPSLIAFDTPLQRDEASVTVWSLKPNVILKLRTGPDHNADVSALPRLHISNSLLFLPLLLTPLVLVPLPSPRPYSVCFSSVSATTHVPLHLTVPMRCSSLDLQMYHL